MLIAADRYASGGTGVFRNVANLANPVRIVCEANDFAAFHAGCLDRENPLTVNRSPHLAPP